MHFEVIFRGKIVLGEGGEVVYPITLINYLYEIMPLDRNVIKKRGPLRFMIIW
jgi:hypothetical protein